MQVAPLYKLPKGEPVWLLIGSDSDGTFAAMRGEFVKKIRFVRLDPRSDDGRSAMEEFSIQSPPASVLADSRGRVVEKIEGKPDAAAMRKKLKALVGK